MNKLKYIFLILSIFFITGNVYAENENTIEEQTTIEEKTIDEQIDEEEQKEEQTTEDKDLINEKTSYKVIFEDDVLLLTNEEKELLKKQMYELTEYGNILFKTINHNSYASTETFARDYYHNKVGTSSGTLFLIDMKYRNIYIFSDGSNNRIITRSKALIITDNVYKYASNKEYYECAKEAFIEIQTLLEGGRIAEPMRYISNIVISLTVSAFITLFIASRTTRIRVVSDKELLKKCNISFDVSNVTVTKIGEHSVYSPQSDGGSSGGGSSGGGGGSSGGGSSGSGGGHSF